MPNLCAVVGCGNWSNRNHDKSFYRLLSVPEKALPKIRNLASLRRERYLAALKRDDLDGVNLDNFRICSDHFISKKPAQLEDADNPDWIPSQNLGYNNRKNASLALDRFQRASKRKKLLPTESPDAGQVPTDQGSTNEATIDDEVLVQPPSPEINNLNLNSGTETQTDLSGVDYENLVNDWRRSEETVRRLEERVAKLKLDEDYLRNDDEKTLYYTGIPSFAHLWNLYELLHPHVNLTSKVLTKFQQFLIVMMRLRLNLDVTDLAYRFNVSRRTVSRVFDVWIVVMYQRLKSFVLWPDRNQLVRNMPASFLECFGSRVTVIVDCFEVFIEKPSNLEAAAQCWSNYKHHHTVIFLIGVSPQGCVTFISKAWGGRASDKYITEHSGFLDLLVPGDVILADRGFTCQDAVRMQCATVEMPAFTRGRKQLSPYDIERTRNIAHVRIHVERIIGSLRQKFRFLSGTLPITMLNKMLGEHSQLDMILQVCCALLNLCPYIVPKV